MFTIQPLSQLLIIGKYGVGSQVILEDVSAFMSRFGHDLNVFRLAQILNTVLVFGGAALIMSFLITSRPFGYFKVEKGVNYWALLYLPIMLISILPIALVVQHFVSQISFPEKLLEMQASTKILQEGLLGDTRTSVFIVNLIMIAVCPAIFEELLFRGILQPLFIKNVGNHHFGILITGFVFGFIHLQIINLFPIVMLGVLLGYIYYWTKNIWFPIIAHFIFNGMQATSFFFANRSDVLPDVSQIEMVSWTNTLIAIVIFAGSTYLFYSAQKQHQI